MSDECCGFRISRVILLNQGYTKSDFINDADVIFVNTCAIRDHAEEKVHSQLGRYDLIKKEKPDVIMVY